MVVIDGFSTEPFSGHFAVAIALSAQDVLGTPLKGRSHIRSTPSTLLDVGVVGWS
jgi:hypothetical protein